MAPSRAIRKSGCHSFGSLLNVWEQIANCAIQLRKFNSTAKGDVELNVTHLQIIEVNSVNVVTIGRDGWHDVRQRLSAPVQVVVIRPGIGHTYDRAGGVTDHEDVCHINGHERYNLVSI